MSETPIVSNEQKQKFTNPLDEFKSRLSSADIIVVKNKFENLNPEDTKLYEKLRSLSEKFPKLPQWFMIMCGEKFQEKNIKEVTESLKI
jgi:hypothetical protein